MSFLITAFGCIHQKAGVTIANVEFVESVNMNIEFIHLMTKHRNYFIGILIGVVIGSILFQLFIRWMLNEQ